MARVESSIIRDIPEIRDLEHSDSEVVYQPHFAGEARFKSFHSNLVQKQQGLLDLQENFRHLIDSAKNYSEEKITRVQMRSVFDQKTLEMAQKYQWFQDNIEGICNFRDDRYLVYIAKNSKDRTCQSFDDSVVSNIVSSVSYTQYQSPNELLSKPAVNGYQMGIFEGLKNRSDLDKIVYETTELYRRFGWTDQNEVRNFLTGPDRIFAGLLDSNGTIQAVSILLFEFANINNETLVMGELTEASSNVSGIGAYAALSQLLILEAAHLSHADKNNNIDMLYGESNAMSGAVQSIVNKQGRRRSRNTALSVGFPDAGRLKQQVYIDSGVEQRSSYNDLWLNYITNEDLMRNHLAYYENNITYI